MKFAAAVAATLLFTATLVGCSNDKPAVCDSVDNLQTSIEDIKSIDVTSPGAVSDLESGLTAIKSDLATLKTDAESQYATQVDAVDSAFTTLSTSVDAAKTDPTAATLAAATAAVKPLTTAVQTLSDDVSSTC